MALINNVPIWKRAPFIRLLLPLITGILLQWYLPIPLIVIVSSGLSFSLAYFLFNHLPLSLRFKIPGFQGLLLNMILLTGGLFITWQNDIRNYKNWFGNIYQKEDYLLVRINEPVTEKARSYKAEGDVEAVIHEGTAASSKGKLLLYFAKDPLIKQLSYGSRILLGKMPEPVKNAGNPGSFNYEQYAAFQQIFHTVFLKTEDWQLADEEKFIKNTKINWFKGIIYLARDKILSILRKNIDPEESKLSIAEALLIGYTNDLDRTVLQAYTNTGVVHIIAISGMHLTLIYLLLAWIFSRVPLVNRSKWLQLLLVLSCLWFFSFLTGAGASVLRAAIMFSFINVGRNLAKATSIYNSLAASAFVLLCYNPYLLWDVGFQLSYLAVAGILVFQKPIYQTLKINNRWKNKVWEMLSVTLAAQILTFPICLYYFHQFPLLFLLSNLVAIPLSSLILYFEIGLLMVSWVPYLGTWVGKMTEWMVALMNMFIKGMNKIPYALWQYIPASIISTWILYVLIISISTWLINKNLKAMKLSIFCIPVFLLLMSYDAWIVKQQKKLIVYNFPQHRAIDFVVGDNYLFVGDTLISRDVLLTDRYLKPARLALQLKHCRERLTGLFQKDDFIQFDQKRIILIDKPVSFEALTTRVEVDLIIISGNPELEISRLAATFNCRQYVFDASNSLWKIVKWQKESEALHLRSYSIPSQGAFVLDVK